MDDFLFELGTEELPSLLVSPLAEALKNEVEAALQKAELGYTSISAFATPRRIAFLVENLQAEQPEQKKNKRGPSVEAAYDKAGNPSKALLGFAASLEVPIHALKKVSTEKGEWIEYHATIPGETVQTLMPRILEAALAKLPIPKLMRWGKAAYAFARPVHWMVMLYGKEVLPAAFLGVEASNITYGHRFHSPSACRISHPKEYEKILEQAFVIADFQKRKNSICQQIQEIEKKVKAHAALSEALLTEVTSIVEWPQALCAEFDPAFLAIPKEVLQASIQSHQKSFVLQGAQGALLPYFITIANLASKDPQQVIAGNQKVMKARLSDAAFFFEQDQKEPLSARLSDTSKVVFQAQLGSLFDKAMRLKAMVAFLSQPLQLDIKDATRAAECSKCDLLTGMVGEFPELQGIMGEYYALHHQESSTVALALREQYLPQFSKDMLPRSPLGAALSLADRLDTLIGIFSIGQKPTGVKDPFKLRRHALALVRILQTISTPLYLDILLKEAASFYQKGLEHQAALLLEVHTFILERVFSFYQLQGISADKISAVRARQDQWLWDMDRRVQALHRFFLGKEATALSLALKRVHNILAPCSWASTKVEPALLQEEAEIGLYQKMKEIEAQVAPWYATGEYDNILTQFAILIEPLDMFFAKVMIMVEDTELKHNRLSLLLQLQTCLTGVADLTLVHPPSI